MSKGEERGKNISKIINRLNSLELLKQLVSNIFSLKHKGKQLKKKKKDEINFGRTLAKNYMD